MQEIFQRFASYIDLGRLRVENFSGVIFFCGGKILNSRQTPISARDFLFRKIQEEDSELLSRIFFAEDIGNWFSDLVKDHYIPEDLLIFEEHLSGLASFIYLIVESPGSIAELGAFSANPLISERLMAVVSQENIREDSFITLGPLQRLQKKRGNRVYVYPFEQSWNKRRGGLVQNLAILEEQYPALLEDLKTFEEQKLEKNPSFSKEMEGHISLLIGDLIGLFSALKIGEIEAILKKGGLTLKRKKIKGHLLILKRLGLIQIYEYRNTKFYISLRDRNFIQYNFHKAPPELTDRSRLKVTVNDLYRKNDKDRLLAIRAVRKAQGRGE